MRPRPRIKSVFFLFWEVSHGIEFIDTLVMRNLTCFRKSYICVRVKFKKI